MDLDIFQNLARHLMDKNGLTQWSLHFDRAKRRAGMCIHRDQTLSFSAPLISIYTQAQARDIILHEIAHALAGQNAGHGPIWKKHALNLGASPTRLISEDNPTVPPTWTGTCPSGHVVGRFRRPSRLTSCAKCCKHYNPSFLFTWTKTG